MTQNARTGRTLLIADGTGGGATVIAAMRSTNFTIQGKAVDVTDKSSSGQYRELLAWAGVVSVTVGAKGLLSGAAQTQTLVSRALARSIDNYRITFDNGDVLEGPFQLVQFEAAGDYNNEQTYQLSFESGGALTFTTA
ncbi:MAG: phage tail protein [Alphaproteobacteria bacterium]|nr:phage tail protein [Alphaproteobacteria bacterium]